MSMIDYFNLELLREDWCYPDTLILCDGEVYDRIFGREVSTSANENIMDAEKIQEYKQRMLEEYARIVGLPLAEISPGKDMPNSLNESDYDTLQDIAHALALMDRGEYGKCRGCSDGRIPEHRLNVVPWDTVCANCRESNTAILKFWFGIEPKD